MSALSLSDDTKLWQNLIRNVRSRSKGENWSDPFFADTASALYQFYNHASAAEMDSAKHTLVAYLELVRHDWGLEAVGMKVKELVQRQAPAATLAIAAQNAARAEKEFELALVLVTIVAEQNPRNSIVNLTLGQSAAALGRWQLVDEIALRVIRNDAVTPWTAERWTRLLLDSVCLSNVRAFLKFLPEDNPNRKVNEIRLSSFDVLKGECPFAMYLINLDREPRKLRLSTELLAKGGYEPERFAAVDGADLPVYAHERLGSSKEIYERNGAGAVATALSHIGVWEKFLQSNDDYCFVAEDDAAPYVHWSYHADQVDRLVDFDLVWANERMSLCLGSEPLPTDAITKPEQVLASRPPQYIGTGADGYMISRRGAEQLLQFFEKDLIRGHVDGQMVAYSISRGATLGNESATLKTLRALGQELSNDFPIKSACLSVPAITANDHGVSNTAEITREHRLTRA